MIFTASAESTPARWPSFPPSCEESLKLWIVENRRKFPFLPENVNCGKSLKISNLTSSPFSTFPPFYPLLLPLPPPATDLPFWPAAGSWKLRVFIGSTLYFQTWRALLPSLLLLSVMTFLFGLSEEDESFSISYSPRNLKMHANLILKTLTPLLFLEETFFQHRRLGSQLGILSSKLLSKRRISNIFLLCSQFCGKYLVFGSQVRSTSIDIHCWCSHHWRTEGIPLHFILFFVSLHFPWNYFGLKGVLAFI